VADTVKRRYYSEYQTRLAGRHPFAERRWFVVPKPMLNEVRRYRMRRSIIILAGILPLLNAGCVSIGNYSPSDSWPKPVAAKNLEQFEGVFLNHSFDSETGKAAENGNELFVFLLGPAHAGADEGQRVEIHADDGGQQLELRLLDKRGHQSDELYLTARGDLLARTSENSVSMAMMLIPSASTTKYWMFWPKLGGAGG
jgi:hypothetical protein